MDFLLNAIVSALIMPFQLMLIPIDSVLSHINGIETIPNSISSILGYVGNIPQTLVNLFGLNPLLWNSLLLVFVAYLGLIPAVNGVKKIVAWLP